MGYCSEVGLCLTEASAKALINTIQEAKEIRKRQLVTDLLNAALTYSDDSGAVAYHWDSIKWYTDFADVGFIEAFVSDLPWESYLFIRIGEEPDDIDYRGDFWDNPFAMNLNRYIALG